MRLSASWWMPRTVRSAASGLSWAMYSWISCSQRAASAVHHPRRVYRFFAGGPFWATAAFTSALNAPASTFSPSWISIAPRVLPSKLELKRREGSGVLAPRANVSFTTFVYASPVQTIPWCDQTGVPLHFHSSIISGSARRTSARMRGRVSPRHPPSSRMRWSMSREAGFPLAGSWLVMPAGTTATFSSFRTLIGLASRAPRLAFAPAFAGPLLLVGFRYDKLARSFLDALHVALVRTCLRQATR